MASSFITWFISSFSFIPFLLLLMGSDHVLLVAGRCREDQQSLLLQLKHGLNLSYPSFSRVISCREDQQSLLLQFKHCLNLSKSIGSENRLVEWNSSTDCCEWPGIKCDLNGLGRVVGLNLSFEQIIVRGGIDDSSALFSLGYLEELDLSDNFFNTTIPGALGNLINLRYLHLSDAGFYGQIPTAISQLTSLVSLDLSYQNLKIESTNLALLVQNLTKLTKLRLDGVDLSTQGKEWFHVLSSSLPNLRELSLSKCNLSAPMDAPSLSKLQSLTDLYLDHNNFSSLIPDIIQDLKNLTALRMSNCGLRGTFPKKIVQNLTQLEYLDFSHNQLVGNIPYAHWENIHNLVQVDLRDNFFNGTIPPSLFSIPSLKNIDLSNNQVQGQIPEFSANTSSTLNSIFLNNNFLNGSIPPSLFSIPSLKYIDLSNNQLVGPIPPSIFELSSLHSLFLSSNRLSGKVQLSWFQTLQNLTSLDLSYNNLTVDANINKSSTSSPVFPQLRQLHLPSCNLRTIPELGNQLSLSNLDLSDNNINGVIPRWIMDSTTLISLNLSHNNLVGFEVQHFASTPTFLDMHDNQLQGNFPFIPFPLPLFDIWYIDFSHNHLNGSIPARIFNNLYLNFLSLSNNSFTGTIPTSMCDAVNLEIINLSNNHLNGTIPSCLIETMKDLSVLDLSGNMFTGNIPNTFHTSCRLQTLNFHNNQLQGTFPKSLKNCTKLEVLDIGNNKIAGPFPCLQGEIKSTLRVLILRNNLFHGSIQCSYDDQTTWQQLQIVDLAFNNFSGPLNAKYLASWEAMMENGKGTQALIEFWDPTSSFGYYQVSIIVIKDTVELEFVKVLTAFKSIDLSHNNFDGPIPQVIGKFKGLQVLNLSQNALISQIPSTFVNLSRLESLDLSDNMLSGHIPKELADLTFLSCINLSNNHLVGSIPTGRQFDTFENTSYGGNPKLCGKPLTRSCTSLLDPPDVIIRRGKSNGGTNWDKLSKAFGYLFGLTVVMLPASLWPSFRVWYWPKIDSLILWMFPKLYVKDWNNRLRKRQSQRRTKKIATSR